MSGYGYAWASQAAYLLVPVSDVLWIDGKFQVFLCVQSVTILLRRCLRAVNNPDRTEEYRFALSHTPR